MLIAVPLSDRNFQEGLKACQEAGADMVELRVDMFEKLNVKRIKNLIEEVHKVGLKTILTIRSEKEGGKHIENREELFRELSPISDYTDIELSSQDIIPVVRQAVKSKDRKLIISYHNFEMTPSDWILREIFREAKRWGADIVKVATRANSYQDVARLLCIGHQEEGEKILICMGKMGSVSRLAGFAFGSVISYAFVDEAVAEGQIHLREMVRLRSFFYG